MTERKLRLTRNDPSRDPMLKGVWISPASALPTPPTPPTPPPSQPFVLASEPPMTEQDKKWKALLDIANDVIDEVRRNIPDVNHELLLQVVRDVVQGSLNVADIAAIYRHRAEYGDKDGDHGR